MDERYSEAQVQRAFDIVRKWDATQLEARVRADMGSEVMGLLGALARNSYPNADEDELSRVMHLMVLSFMLRGELERETA
jgi:hypothetical protein